MKLIDQYCTREQAQKLEQIGIITNYCQMMLVSGGHDGEIIVYNNESLKSPLLEPQPTPSVAELGLMLLGYIGGVVHKESEPEAKIRFDYLCHLISENVILVQEINNKLQKP